MEKKLKRIGLSDSITLNNIGLAKKVLEKEGIFIEGNTGCVWIMKLSSNGKFLASTDESKVFVWHVKKERLKAVLRFNKKLFGIEFYLSEYEIIVLVEDGIVYLENFKTHNKRILTQFQSISNINIFGLSFNMEHLIIIQASAEINIFDIKNNIQYIGESLTDKYVKALKVCKYSSRSFLAVVCVIMCYDIQEKCVIYTLEGHLRTIVCLALSKNEEYLISTSVDSTLIIWDLQSRQKLFQSIPIHLTIYSAIWANSQKYYITSEKTIKIWEFDSYSLADTLISGADTVISLAITPNDCILISGTTRGSIDLWDFESKMKIKVLQNEAIIKKILFIDDFNSFLTLGTAGSIFLWSVKHKKIVNQFEPSYFFREISKLGDDKVAMVKGDSSIEVYKTGDWTKVREITTGFDWLKLMRNLTGEAFILCSLNEIEIWSNSDTAIYSDKSKLQEVNSICVTKSQRFFVLCQSNFACEVWIYDRINYA